MGITITNYPKAVPDGNGLHHRTYLKAGRHFRDGQRAAAIRAETSACALLNLPIQVRNEKDAATKTGSNSAYVGALVAVLETGDELLLQWVRSGQVSIIKAGEIARTRLNFLRSFHKMKPTERAAAAQELGVDVVWNTMLSPALDEAAE
jgi:hypothetical protein